MILFLAGCRGDLAKPKGYFGPTESMYEVVQQINARNVKLSQFWLSHDFKADITDEQKHKHHVDGNGALIYRWPQDLLLTGQMLGVGKVFDIGSNNERYWLSVPQDKIDTMWWGKYENLGKPCVDMGQIEIRPDLIIEVLGVFQIDDDFTRLPAPVMQFNNDEDAYMFTWVARAPDRLVATKEVWYDRASKMPRLVVLFDGDGRPVLRAYLSGVKKVKPADPEIPEADWAQIAQNFDLLFPQSGAKMLLTVNQVKFAEKGVPNDRTFKFPASPTVSKIIQLDQACDDQPK